MKKIKTNNLIVIVGPTASGKSALAVKIAKKNNGEIISADSRQVYKGMDIGTGKVTKKEMANIPHYMLSIVSPKKRYSVDQFVKDSKKHIADIIQKNKTPIIVGGTGFYIDCLIYSIPLANTGPNLKLRSALENKNNSQLFNILKKLDPKRSENIEPNNKRRLIRAIEIARSGNQKIFSITDFYKNKKVSIAGIDFKPKWIGLKPINIEERIAKRLDIRIKQGLLREVKKLKESGLSWKKIESFGLEYRWSALLLQGKIDKAEFRSNLLRDIIRYSKRQNQWFKRNKNIKWFKDSKKVVL